MTQENNPAILAYRKIESIINNNVSDINAYRSAKPAGDQKKTWIYPTVPTAKDEFYPRITIKLNAINAVEVNAGRFFETTYDNGSATSDTYGNLWEMTFTIFAFIKRDQKHSVTLIGEESTKLIKNNLQTLYLINKIAKELEKNRNEFVQDIYQEVTISVIEPPYEDGKYFWASSIVITLTAPNTWGDEYGESELIADYELTITASRS